MLLDRKASGENTKFCSLNRTLFKMVKTKKLAVIDIINHIL
jgi:hypothetical protein